RAGSPGGGSAAGRAGGESAAGRAGGESAAGCGAVVAERSAANAVLRGGAELVARRLTGLEAQPISSVGVGFGTEAADPGATALTPPPDPAIPAAALSSAVRPEDVTVKPGGQDEIVVSLATVFHPTVELADVTEAGLFGGSRLYNQVVFEPVTLRPGQDVTFFWEIDFPYGH
ncbi:hypothetical protein, partial [Actinomadura sp. HBU206391]|uniref:hypothetical protein n=1 Tax=Actinomadura sp. HBU206391 TaxID=2731692 RepID=UPI001C9CC3A7